ncbi:hypothetical protein SCH01S_52_00500 [Sphingomonas changbaiensis NBRC 104936]|uniref:HTH luxR-type domain-containing protein n=2 Tax=Sphingomonas changbaiensis TaxID=529705 RepID=A0A0E9MSZ5_9SPHN|nr:hypothetical protein SCH01S_52_00500 [Sphingomonas changbaiensis NBRC 104936]
MLSAVMLSELVGMIYDCALEPARWPDTLTHLRDALGFANASLSLIDLRSGDTPLNITIGVEEPWLTAMNGYGAEIIDQWGGARAIQDHPFDEPAVLSRMNPAALTTNRYRTEWADPQGLNDALAIVLSRDEGAIGSLAMGRHYSAGPISDHDVSLASLLIPHLQRAITISRLLDLRTATAATFDAVVDQLAAAVLLIEADRTIVHVNAAGRELLAAGGVFRRRADRLVLCHAGADKALAVALDRLACETGALGREGFSVPLRTDGCGDRVLHLLPLRPRLGRAGALATAVAAIFIAPRLRDSGSAARVVADLFDLTPAEARVLDHAAAGKSMAATAQALGISKATARTHLLRVFDKTGVHRQAELVALVLSFDLPVAR